MLPRLIVRRASTFSTGWEMATRRFKSLTAHAAAFCREARNQLPVEFTLFCFDNFSWPCSPTGATLILLLLVTRISILRLNPFVGNMAIWHLWILDSLPLSHLFPKPCVSLSELVVLPPTLSLRFHLFSPFFFLSPCSFLQGEKMSRKGHSRPARMTLL
jgi:hypothetical protein